MQTNWLGLDDLRTDLVRFLGRRCRDSNEVDDVIQETMLRAARYRHGLDKAACLRGWCLRIARNVLADRHRRRHRNLGKSVAPELLDSIEARDTQHVEGGTVALGNWRMDRRVAIEWITAELGGLSLQDRNVLTSYYGGNGNSGETSRECGIPQRLVKVRLFRARRKLLQGMRKRMALSSNAESRANCA